MTDTPAVSEEAKRAVLYCEGQFYEAVRGFAAAYQVDTGKHLDVTIVPWAELGDGKQILFGLLSKPALDILLEAAVTIGGIEA